MSKQNKPPQNTARPSENTARTRKQEKSSSQVEANPACGQPERKLPELRFPEFQTALGWEMVNLKNLLIGNPNYGVNAPAVPYLSNLPTYLRITDIDEDGYFLSKSKVSVNIMATEDNYLKTGDIVLARTGASVGKSYRYKEEDGKLVFAGFLIRIRPDTSKVNSIYLYNFLTTKQYWNWVRITSMRSGQPGINSEEYASLPIPVPSAKESSLLEQQKIADCLSSIDDLIALQTRKLQALKAQKKGLMQQLFPDSAADTQQPAPKLRFPEFQTASGWKEERLGDFIENYSEKISAYNNEYPIYSSTREGLRRQKDYYSGHEIINGGEYGLVPSGYFVYRHMSDDDTFKFNINLLEKCIAVSKEYPVFFTINLNSSFLWYKLNYGLDFEKFAIMQKKGGTRTRLYFKILCSFRTLLPSLPEQQKIAACLTTVDDLIAAQTEKTEALKAHKKALMQRLFPA